MTFRDALLDAIDAQDEAVSSVAEAGVTHGRIATGHILVAAALPYATPESHEAAARNPEAQKAIMECLCHAKATADEHALTHVPRIRAAAPGRDEGPITRAHLMARRGMRG